MKALVFMTQFYWLNGAERLGVELAQELNRRGIPADILSMYTDDLPGVAEAKEKLLASGIPAVHFLGMRVRPPLMSVAPAIRRFRRLLRKGAYNVVETSQMSPTVIASWGTRGMGVGHVAGLHDVFRRDRYNSIRHKLWRHSVRRNTHTRFYAISEYARQHWLEYSGTLPERTRLIYNAIPDDCFVAQSERTEVRRELAIPDDGIIALFVGRMLKRKGIDTLLDSLGAILSNRNLYLVYVGDWDQPSEHLFSGEDGLELRMRRQVEQKSWGGRVRFLGRRNDVPRLMASSDLLVHPARLEGFGLVLAEAMAAGLPVVASNVEGIPEVLQGTKSLMVPPNDPAVLRDAVTEMLRKSSAERGRIISLGRKRAEAFRIRRRIDELTQYFDEVMQCTSGNVGEL